MKLSTEARQAQDAEYRGGRLLADALTKYLAAEDYEGARRMYQALVVLEGEGHAQEVAGAAFASAG